MKSIASCICLSAVVSVRSILVVSGIGSVTGSILCFVFVLLLILRRAVVCIAVVVAVACVAVVVAVVCVVLHDNLHSENR